MAYTLGAAWTLSSCNKAQTRQGDRVFVVIWHPGDWRDEHEVREEEELVVIEPDGYACSNGPAATHEDFVAELARKGLEMNARIWHSIGYTPLP